MIDWLIRQIFKVPALRINIFQEVPILMPNLDVHLG